MKNLHTLSVHSGVFNDGHGAVMPPIYATSTFAQPAPGQHTGYEYSRSGNPTRHALETAIAVSLRQEGDVKIVGGATH